MKSASARVEGRAMANVRSIPLASRGLAISPCTENSISRTDNVKSMSKGSLRANRRSGATVPRAVKRCSLNWASRSSCKGCPRRSVSKPSSSIAKVTASASKARYSITASLMKTSCRSKIGAWPGRCRPVAGAFEVEQPVAAPLTIRLQHHAHADEHEALDVDLPGKDRKQSDLHLEALDADHGFVRRPVGVFQT